MTHVVIYSQLHENNKYFDASRNFLEAKKEKEVYMDGGMDKQEKQPSLQMRANKCPQGEREQREEKHISLEGSEKGQSEGTSIKLKHIVKRRMDFDQIRGRIAAILASLRLEDKQ